VFRTLRIALGRGSVIIRVVPVAAPFVNIVANVIKAERVGSVLSDWLGASLPACGVVWKRLRRIIAPGKLFLFEAAAGGTFPFGFGGKAEVASGLVTQPFAVARGIMPGGSGYGLLRVIEVGIAPERRRCGSGRNEESRVLLVCDLSGGEQERVDPYATDRFLAILAFVRSHEKNRRRDSNEGGYLGTLRISRRFRLG